MNKEQSLNLIKTLPEKTFKHWPSIREGLARIPLIYVILFFALLTRIYKIDSMGVSGQEIKNIGRITIFSSNPMNFFDENISTNLYYFLQFLWGKIYGFSVTDMRFFSSLLAVLGLLVFYKFTEEWFSKKLALIATFLLSISSFHIFTSRAISHEILYPLVFLTALYFLTLAYRQKSKLYFVVAGIFLGLGFYTSEITIMIIFVFLASGVYFYYKNKKFLTSFLKEKVIGFLVVLAVSAPFIYLFIKNPMNVLSQFTYQPKTLFYNFQDLTASLLYNASGNIMYNIGHGPLFDPYVTVTFFLGLLYLVYSIKRRKFYFLVAWIGLVSMVIVFKESFSMANILFIVPVIFIASAIIQSYVLQKWFKTFPFNRAARITMALGIGFFFALSLSYNLQKVFLAWEKDSGRIFSYNVKSISSHESSKRIYLYGSMISHDSAQIIFRIKDPKQLVNVQSPNDIKDIRNAEVVMSTRESNTSNAALLGVNFKEQRGEDIVLYKGVVK